MITIKYYDTIHFYTDNNSGSDSVCSDDIDEKKTWSESHWVKYHKMSE